MIFADFPAPLQADVYSFLGIIAALLVMIYYSLNIYDHFKIKPPLHDLLAKYCTNEDLKRALDQIEKSINSITSRQNRFDERQLVVEKEIHERITKIGEDVSHLVGLIEGQANRRTRR